MELIFDTHAHYDDSKFDLMRESFLNNLNLYGVQGIVNVAANIETSKISVEYANRFNYVFASVGIHPYDISNLPNDYLKLLRNLAKNEKVVAIGEIGLDYHMNEIPKDKQQKCLEEQLELAQNLNLPVIVHSRNAYEDTLAILKNAKPRKCVVHCFSYSHTAATEFLKLDFYLGFTGVVTFKNATKPEKVLKEMPREKILVETDCPYMAPEPHRGECCDSSMLKFTAKKIAQIRNENFENMVRILNENAGKFYGIKL